MTAPHNTTGDVSQLMERLESALPVIEAEAATGEALRRPTPAAQAALRGSGVFGLTVPIELGGIGATPSQVLKAIEAVSYADASMGWLVIALHTDTARTASEISDAAARDLFGQGRRMPLIAGQNDHAGTALRVDGGYRISGTWRFAPGLSMASHVRAMAVEEQTGETIIAIVPRDQITIIDNWDVLGLRATASLDYSIDDVFVADDRVTSGEPQRGGPSHRMSAAQIAGLNQAGWAMGVGRRLLDELRELSRQRASTPGALPMSDEYFGEFARHEARLRAACSLAREVWADNELELAAGGELSHEQQTLSHLASSHLTRTALEISQLVHRFAGPSILRDGVLQRIFRDVHAGTQHRGTSAVVTQQCGRMLSGVLPDGAHWEAFDIVVPESTHHPAPILERTQ